MKKCIHGIDLEKYVCVDCETIPSFSKSASATGLSDAEQAINALEKLADYHETINKLNDARSNRAYIKVIKGQLICHKLVDKALGR